MVVGGCPLDYARSCAPRAIAAVTRLDVHDVARLLWPLRAFWWPADVPASTPGRYGTPNEATGGLLLRLGYGVDWYDGDGTLLADTAVYAEYLGRLAADRVLGGPRRPAPRPAPATSGVAARRPDPSHRPLRAWLERHRVGRWLYVIYDGAEAHILAAWGRDILTGEGERCHDWPVSAAFRVHPPHGRR